MSKNLLFDIVYEDDFIVAINKSSGALSIPDRSGRRGLSILEHLELRSPTFTVHRLDRETSGIMLFAKNKDIHKELNIQFQEREVEKCYLALAVGAPWDDEFEVDAAIIPGKSHTIKSLIHAVRGKPSLTKFEVVQKYRGYTLLHAWPFTGRTHQIRVHLEHMQIPIIGDDMYGGGDGFYLSTIKKKYKAPAEGELPLMSRMALHAKSITFVHPKTEQELTVEAPLHKDFAAVVRQLEKWAKSS